jgi:hypothetical protein
MHATRSFTPLRCHAVAALLIAMLAAAVALLARAEPAAADSRVCTPESRGCASFKRAGNTFDVCDYGFDGESWRSRTATAGSSPSTTGAP